ncbi:MAG: hypothetical protein V7693_07595 [Halopseudomonas sabulinigri]
MSELSPNTKSVVEKLFKSREAKEVCDMLEIDCGTESLGCEGWTPEQMERIRFAVLKFGGETDGGLEAAIELANTDWRDLLMAAGFGEDLNAHQKWSQSIAN